DADPPCIVLCAPERAAPPRVDRSAVRRDGPVLVGGVVRRLERHVVEGRHPAAGGAHRGGGPDVAPAGGLEALLTRAAIDHRGAAGGSSVLVVTRRARAGRTARGARDA